MYHLAVVINPANQAKAKSHRQYNPDIDIFQIGPQQSADKHRHQDQRTAHGWRAGFAQMTLRAITANCLTHLQTVEQSDHSRSERPTDCQCGDHRKNSAQGEILHR